MDAISHRNEHGFAVGCRDKPGNDNEAQPFHSVIAGLVPATHARCKHQRSRTWSAGGDHCEKPEPGMVRQSVRTLPIRNMLQRVDPGALSYRRNGSISPESALIA
jgi:hypothetical protein